MVRVNQQDHLHRHRLLRELWLFVPSIYSTLLPTQQWEVHRLYEPSEFFEDDDLLSFVKAAIEREPSLPNRVGKHWKRINQLYTWASSVADGPEDWRGIHDALVTARAMGQISLERVPTTMRRKGYVVRVAPIMNPHPDYDMLARAFLEQASLMRAGKERPRDSGEPSSR